MRLIVNVRDGVVVLDGVGRKVPDLIAENGLQHLSWDGTTGISIYDEGDPVYFDSEADVLPYVSAWTHAPEPEPPPLPPWESEEPLPLPGNAIAPQVLPAPEPPVPLPKPDDPPPEGWAIMPPWEPAPEDAGMWEPAPAKRKRK